VVDLVTEIRQQCARVAAAARHVAIATDRIREYAAALPPPPPPSDDVRPDTSDPEQLAAFYLTLDAINFGSGWFPTLRKRAGRSGYFTVALGLCERFHRDGPYTAAQLQAMNAAELSAVLGQDPDHELMALFASSLRDLGARVAAEYGSSFEAVVAAANGSAVTLATMLADWECFADASIYDARTVPFYKRAQIAAADQARAGILQATDLERLTIFADNLVPHVLRVDGILNLDPELVARIDREQLIEHGSPEEVEIRACALHAVELIVAARRVTEQSGRDPVTAADVDQTLWHRGQLPNYKARPRHRSRCTAY
jgi:hypothetical protein